MGRLNSLFLASIATVTLASPGLAQERERQPAPPVAGFTQAEKDLIASFFAKNKQAVKPLPPGIAKNLARGKPLPAGIAKQRLPQELTEALPARTGAEIEITIFGDRVVMLDVAGLVVDVLEGIFGNQGDSP